MKNREIYVKMVDAKGDEPVPLRIQMKLWLK